MLRAMKIRKRVRVGKVYKKLKAAAKFFKGLCRKLFRAAQAPPLPPPAHDNLAFMTCIIKVNPSRSGWQKTILSLLRNFKGSRYKMDQNGVVELSGIADPKRVLKKLGRSKRVELQWFQFGECSSYLFMPPAAAKKEENPAPAPAPAPYNGFPSQAQNYGLPYHPPQRFTHYLPY